MSLGLFVFNIVLAFLWMLVWGAFDVYTMAAGLVMGYVLLAVVTRAYYDKPYGGKLWRAISFSVYFVKILVKANLLVAWEIMTPGLSMTPRIISYDVAGMTDFQITSFANAITLTPGTLSVDVSDDNDNLYVHCMYAEDRAAAVKDLDELRDRIMSEIFS